MYRNPAPKQANSLSKNSGFSKTGILIVLIVIISLFLVFKTQRSHVLADSQKITSAIPGYCLDVYLNKSNDNAKVDTWKCNDTTAQAWDVSDTNITHGNGYCLTIQNDKTVVGSLIVLNKCSQSQGQIWLRDKNGFINPNSGLCLSTSTSNPENQLFIDSCDKLTQNQENWSSTSQNLNTFSCRGTEGEKVSCNAINDWITWQSGKQSHNALLTEYTDGTPYEEWCADFVSYVYKQSGHPFTNGETNGWDENLANNIQNQGFTYHDANSGYIPKTGDVAFFSYSGGHVEIVISGGKFPTFVYGNSGTIDPSTGNGEMMTNTKTSDGSMGQLLYYLSPNK